MGRKRRRKGTGNYIQIILETMLSATTVVVFANTVPWGDAASALS